ncbi:MAG: hypothetical protein ABIR15_03320 [Chitinophagaceae bacterium]
MAKKPVLQKSGISKMKPIINPIDKKEASNIMAEKVAEKKQNNPLKKSSVLVAASKGRSVVDAVNAHSSKDVRGSSGLSNTGTIISYD